MVSVGLGIPNHDVLPGVSANDHHTPTVAGDLNHQDLAARSAGDHHTATVASDLNLADLAARAHADLSDSPADAHHDEAHTVLSHSDGADTCKIATGTYTGDGATSQAITGIGFTVLHVLLWVRGTVAASLASTAMQWTNDQMVDNNAAGLAINDAANLGAIPLYRISAIIALGTDGFTVDDDAGNAHPNASAVVYEFTAWGIEV